VEVRWQARSPKCLDSVMNWCSWSVERVLPHTAIVRHERWCIAVLFL
jgi:hypothetical protein